MKRVFNVPDIGLLVKKRRLELGMTQPQLADICGTGDRFILDLEKGKSTIQMGKVIDIIHMLGLDLYVSERGS